jgi:hypothetical protein
VSPSLKQTITLLAIMCQIVPLAFNCATKSMTHSRIAGLTVAIASIGFAAIAITDVAYAPLRMGMLGVCIAAALQYAVLSLLVRAFESKYGHTPQVSGFYRRYGLTGPERALTFAGFVVGLAPAFVIAEVILITWGPPAR